MAKNCGKICLPWSGYLEGGLKFLCAHQLEHHRPTRLAAQGFPEGVLIPRAVWQEVVDRTRAVWSPASSCCILDQIVEISDSNLVSMLHVDLDTGEAEAIVLAREQKTSTVLLDEKDARKVAIKLGFSVLGTVGVLIWAKRAGNR